LEVSQRHKKDGHDNQFLSLQTDGAVATSVTSYLDVGEQRMQLLFRSIADVYIANGNNNNLHHCEPNTLSKLCRSFGILSFQHKPFLDLIMNEFVHRTERYMNGEVNAMTNVEGLSIANIVWYVRLKKSS
jgi:hypothetical protein